MKKKGIVIAIFLGFIAMNLFGQTTPKIIDEIVAIIGNKPILYSTIQEQFEQSKMQNPNASRNEECKIFEELLFQRLMLHQAGRDSLKVGEDQVESELDRRIRYFLGQFGSQEKMEEELGRSIPEIKREFREQVREQLLIQQMQAKITGDIKVTPAEVKEFYNKIPKDSLPFIPAEVQMQQIVIIPKVNEAERQRVRKKLSDIRQEIIDGAKFGLKARLYSQDRVSAAQDGELGFHSRDELVPEFTAAAFRLKGSEVSEIVESPFGFHIIQLIEKRGELANFRHILLKPEPSEIDLVRAEKKLDSLVKAIKTVDSLSFDRAASSYSDDEDTRFNGGKMINPINGTTIFQMDQLDLATFQIINSLKPGEISPPHIFETNTGKKAFRVIRLIEKTKPHVADLKNDYQKIQAAAQSSKQGEVIKKWIARKKNEVYIKIFDVYKDCNFEFDWNKISK
jgi:peptidyl-prolyl cis-trans isomerase SurA